MDKEIKNFEEKAFLVRVLGIVFDPKTKKILIGRRENDPNVEKLKWSFPGGRPEHDEKLEEGLKREVKEKTGLSVESIGVIFARIFSEENRFLNIYYLCEAVGGEEKAGEKFKEIKWVNPEELEKYFTTSFHPKLKEYILGLVN